MLIKFTRYISNQNKCEDGCRLVVFWFENMLLSYLIARNKRILSNNLMGTGQLSLCFLNMRSVDNLCRVSNSIKVLFERKLV